MLTDRGTQHRTQVLSTARRELIVTTARAAAVERLAGAGMPRMDAEAWIAAWEHMTAKLMDFRAAADYWELGFRYAVEERRRGYRPPVG